MKKITRIILNKVDDMSEKTKKMMTYRNIMGVIVVIVLAAIISLGIFYNIGLSRVSKDSTLKTVIVEKGSIASIASTLKENNVIRNEMMFKVYIKLSGKRKLQAGTYEFSENMGTKKIVSMLEKGSISKKNEVSLTFKEGINMRGIASIIEENTNNTKEDVLSLVNDNTYIDSLIDKYWFLDSSIKNSDIYYPLEGYLYPDTYIFKDKDVKVEDIFTKMLDETDNKLSKYKSDIESSKYSIHEIITLASIVELEVANSSDRKSVAGVFINRLGSRSYPTLGSDATSYYGSKIDDWKSGGLSNVNLNDCSNKYNTRCSTNIGIPVGPIGNPSIESVEAVLHPEEHNYYYFVNDCSGKLYLSENENVHNNTINKLKRENNWCA